MVLDPTGMSKVNDEELLFRQGIAAYPISWNRTRDIPFILLFLFSAAAMALDMIFIFSNINLAFTDPKYTDAYIT